MPSAPATLTARLGPCLATAPTGGEWDPADLRLDFASRIFRMIEVLECADVARGWMIGGNAMLGEDTPITVIRESRFSEVESAVTNHLAN